MKVVLKVTVFDRILADLEKAARDNREVDYIAVTPEEHAELRRDRRSDYALESDFMRFGMDDIDPMKATFTTREFEFTGDPRKHRPIRGRRLCVPSNANFMGKPLFVVPEEYMPK